MSEINLSEESSKEDVANYFLNNFKISIEAKNNLIKEDISGEVLLEIQDSEFKQMGMKLGPMKKVRKFLDDNKTHFKNKEIKETITAISKPEEVKDFFERCFNYKNSLNNLDGKGLIELNEESMKSLGLTLGQRKKLVKYIEYFKTIEVNIQEEEEIILTKKSSEEDVAKFLKTKLHFSEDSIDALGLDGESLFLLEITEVQGLTELQEQERENLINYLRERENENENGNSDKNKQKIIITNKSDEKEVAEFLKKELNFKDESIEALSLDGESLFMFEDTEIDNLTEITPEEKDKLKKFLNEEKSKNNGMTKNDITTPKVEEKHQNAETTDNIITQNIIEKPKNEENSENKESKEKDSLDKDKEILNREKQKSQENENRESNKKQYVIQETPGYDAPKFEQGENNPKKESEDIKITKDSSKEDILKFVKIKMNLDETKFNSISESEIDELFKISQEEKQILKSFINKNKEKIKNNESPPKLKNVDNNEPAPSIYNPAPVKEDISEINIKNKDEANSSSQKNNSNNNNEIKNKNDNNNNKLPEDNHKNKNNNKNKIDDPLLNPNIIQNQYVKEERVFEEKQSDKKKPYQIQNLKVEPIYKLSKCNIFFMLLIQEKYINYISVCTYLDESSYFNSSYINFKPIIINEDKYNSSKKESLKAFIVQVPLERPIKKLNITIFQNKHYQEEYNSQIEIRKGIDNFFFVNNLEYDKWNSFPNLSSNTIFTEYLECFFEKEQNKKESFQKSLIKALINKISKIDNIELKVENILKFFKFCVIFNLEPTNIEAIEIPRKKNEKINLKEEYFLSGEDIENLNLKKQKSKFIDLIVCIYANSNKKYLMELIQSKNGKDYCRNIFDLLNIKKLRLSDLSFDNEKDKQLFQKNLLLVSKSKDEVNYVISISDGLTNSLEFIQDNCKKICSILEENESKLRFKDTNYLLSLKNPDNNDNIDKIYSLLFNIIKLTEKKDYKIINLVEIFENFVNLYSDRKLEEICKLNNILGLLQNEKVNYYILDKFYNRIHNKGMNLIRNGQLTVEEIVLFMVSQDIYYYSPKFNKNENRDPIIFSYIPITDINKNYKQNIELIKKYNLCDIFSNSKYNVQKRFQEIILEQMQKIRDFESFFDIFHIDSIDKNFTFLINGKIDKLRYTVLDEKEENYEYLFDIFDKWIICNEKNRLDLNYVTDILKINYNFTSKYYFYLLKNVKMKYIVMIIQNNIISFFLEQNREGNNNAESLISLLIYAPDYNFCLYALDQLNNKIMKEKDFYTKEENQKFLLFKLFFEKCGELIQNPQIAQGKYLYESLRIKYKIYNDLNNNTVRYDIINGLIDDTNDFYNKVLVIANDDSKNIYNKLKKNLKICTEKFSQLEVIEDFYNSFYSLSKREIINLINHTLKNYKQKYIKEIIDTQNLIENNNNFNLEAALEESKNIKYRNSCFFMAIYNKKNDSENFEKSEDEIFKESLNNYKDTIKRIILQKESKEPFFEINNINDILKAVQNPNNNKNKEIDFIEREFVDLGKNDYIKNNLLDDLINFSNKEKISKFLQAIIYFIEAYNEIKNIQMTQFINDLKETYKTINLKEVSGEEIKKAINLLSKFGYDLNNETSLIKFYDLFLGKKDSLLFIKKIKDSKLEIRNLNEFIDESENSQLETKDIDNLIDVYTFLDKFMEKHKNNTDEELFQIFRKEFENEKNIDIKLMGYLKAYGDIIQLFDSYHENPEMTTQKINKILSDSFVKFFKEGKNNLFTFSISYKNQNNEVVQNINELEELRNKILMSSTNTNALKKEGDDNVINKEKMTNDFVNLIDNIKQLNLTLNSLVKSGYPHKIVLSLKIKNSSAFHENDRNKGLEMLIKEYTNINKEFKKSVKKGYYNYPLLRLFYGRQFIQLHEKTKNKNLDISHLMNSVSLNRIKDTKVDYEYNNRFDDIENINKYLEKLFNKNNINLDEIYLKNKVKDEIDLSPGLYRKVKSGDFSNLINDILNIYINLTGNAPILNTLLICNEDTNVQNIKAFLYRAIFCEKPILFLISNIECLELSITQNIIKTLKSLYKLKNKIIKSYLIFIYDRENSGLSRDIGKLIPEKNILSERFVKQPEEKIDTFEKIEVYSSKYSGFGKTTEIIHEIKGKGGLYYYLPIGGSFNRNYLINNLENLHLDLQKGNKNYLHLDLSETDNDDLMNEILLKLIILRFIDSDEKLFYLGYDINLIIEIPKGFIEFDKKYKLLNLFKKIYIDKLRPLRLEENAVKIEDSPISIVAEVLDLYDRNQIGTTNIDLNSAIVKNAAECENIINKHFKVENQNYHQKMNFIKILSIQFKKLILHPYFNYEMAVQDGRGDIIKKARVSFIKNCIALTKVFTRSPFDTVLLRQTKSMELFNKYDDEQALQDGVDALANEKQEIFSFKLIKPSLVFFNRDGYSLSIISNNNKNDQEYKDLKELWNSQNINMNQVNELVDYKNLQHEDFLDQIKKLFSLDTMSLEDLKLLCEKLGNYIFVSDNFIKMVRILLNIEAKIPVILMGETGVGKTKLLEMLATLYGKGTCRWEKLQIHAGTTDQKIVSFIDEVTEKVKNEGKENETTWIFFDEINTCNSLGLITEIMCNHTYLGKKINKNFIFLGACNPYRILKKQMKTTGLVYYNMKEKSKLNNLVYTVNPLPHSLLNFVFDFASLEHRDEEKYIRNTIISIISKIKRTGLIKNIDQNDLNKITNEIIDSIVICHDFIREKYDQSSVSMREIRRFGLFFEYFIKYFNEFDKASDRKIMKSSLNVTLYLCYYLRLNDKSYREALSRKLDKFFKNSFLKTPENEITKITQEMVIEKGKGIALNRALRENLFTCFTCIDNNVPLIIVGKPGTGKSLSFQILYNTLKGQYSDSDMFKKKGKLYRYYYQGSETSTAEGIEQVFSKARKAQTKNLEKNIITLVFFDEMGLAERSSNNPLKVIHFLLERDSNDSVPFLGISNWKLDAAKINRALSLTITDYDIEDLEETAISIAKALNVELSNKYQDYFKTLARTYFNYVQYSQDSIKENKDFHGNRDFYNLIKIAMKELMEKENELAMNERTILTEIALSSLDRNFGGLENSNSKIKELFKKEYGYKYDQNVDLEKSSSVLDMIKKNILDSNSRYLMLISEGNDASDIVKYLLNSLKRKFNELVGSKYRRDIKSGRYSEEILNKIKYIMETDNVLILRDLDMIYASLYDLFNQNFTCMGEKKFARIAFEYAKVSSEVNKDFHVIVIVNKNQIQNLKLDPPFLNRFEKHIVNFNMLLNDKDEEIAEKISEYLDLLATFNGNDKLKIDLEKLLINCKKHNIEGLIFAIKNERKKNNKEEINNIQDNFAEYEEEMIKEVLSRIVPTFCQDIIASMMNSGLDQKYKAINDIVLNLYKQTQFNNFESFFKQIKSKRNIIYTFSKVTENLFEEEKEIKNEFGEFKEQSTTSVMIQSIQSEKDLIVQLKSFNDSHVKKLLIIRFTESDLNKVNSTNYVIDNFQKEHQNLKDKLIIFLIHKQRMLKGVKTKKVIIPDLISFMNEDYYQIFIDNLQGKENSDVLKIMEKKNELAKVYIDNSNFLENKIFTILNYMKYTILFETKELNMKNCTNVIAEKIIKNQTVKNLINNNLKKQGKLIKNVIKDVFISDNLEVNDVDFFEVIGTKLSTYFCLYLLKIVLHSLKSNILNQMINNPHIDLIMKNDFFNNLIMNNFDKTNFNFVPPIRMNINYNKITIYNGLEIPQSKTYLDQLINYTNNEISIRYLKNEELLRKNYVKEEKCEEVTQKYMKQLDRFEDNIKTEMNKNDLFKSIYSQNNEELKAIILEDYLKYFIIKYIEKKNINYTINESLLSFLKLIIRVKLNDANNHHYAFENTQEEFIKIILFTSGYKDEIKSLFDIYIDIQKYCEDITEIIMKVLDEEIIKYEISKRNQKHSKIVNICFFNIMESLLRAILLFSIELINKNKAKFYEYFYSLISVEANLQKINKKLYLYSKEIYNIRYIIKIEEAYKHIHEDFENNYEKIMNNLLEQSVLLYSDNYNNLYNVILELIKIFDETFKEKNEDYVNLLFFVFRQQYRNIYNEEIRIKLLENFLKNKLLLVKSKIFLSETLKDLKPEIYDEKAKKKESQEQLVQNFMNFDIKKLAKFKNLINVCNSIQSEQFNELLLFFFEGQCQSYFATILQNNNNKYTEKCCKELLLNLSLNYLKKAIQYLYEHKNNNDNNLLKLYAIAYLKTYCYYYVEINYNHFDKCEFEEINRLLNDKNENNEFIRNMRNIYIWRLYCKKFENFEQFENFKFDTKNIPIYKELAEKLKKEKDNMAKYIFKESFITPSMLPNYKKLALDIDNKYDKNIEQVQLNYDEINNNFDLFYSILVNKIISYTYGNDKNSFIKIMKNVYETTNKDLKFGEEGNKLYKYLLNYDLFQNEVVKKISDNPLTQEEFEMILYSFRFIFNTQINNKQCFYNEILKKNASQFISNNYIPGSFPLINEYLKSYNMLDEKLKQRLNMGYYICKDCGYLYEVKPCTFPMITDKCPSGHVIGGIDHVCSKKDIRVFYEKQDDDNFSKHWHSYPNWLNSFVHTTIKEFKTDYVDKNIIKPQKGIIKDFEISEFEKKSPVRDINIVSFRILNFILYSYLMASYVLNNLTKEQMSNYLVENLFPHSLFGIVKKNWELLGVSLKEIGVENIQIFMNMIFEKIIQIITNLKSVDTEDKLYAFEKEIDKCIMEIISKKESIDKLNKDYQKMNNELLSFDPQSIKEIILSNYEPSIYDQKIYPDIQYYSISNIQDFNTFINKFTNLKENENKYSLINLLIKRDEDITQDAINMKSLENINKLTNLLLNIYSYKISREDGKSKVFKDEIRFIIEEYNKVNPIQINSEEEFIDNYVKPFIKSWDMIKKKSVQYKCRILRDLDKKQSPLEMKLDNKLCYFLVDDGDKEGGMFLAAAYQHLIEWQNAFINIIIGKNNMNGILNSYVSQLEQEIDIQDATKEEIINIDGNTYQRLNELIFSSSMRNIFTEENKINYKNYNSIIYNYDFIEEELGKIILPGLKKFTNEKIKFVTYLFEGFRGGNSTVLVDYNNKYVPRALSETEKKCLNEFLQINNNNHKFYNDVFTSLQILMNEIIKENYEENYLIYKIIEALPDIIILNEELKKLFKNKYEYYKDEKEKVFTINSLVSVFEYFEALCWKDMSKNILPDYQLELSDESKKFVVEYFEKNKNENKVVNKKNFTDALRKLISRYLAGSRQEIDIKSEAQLKLYIIKDELWSRDIIDNDDFEIEIYEIVKDDILIGNSWKLYDLLGGDEIMNEEINKNKEKEKEDNNKQEQINEQNKDKNIINDSKEGKKDGDNIIDDDNEEQDEEDDSEEKDDF